MNITPFFYMDPWWHTISRRSNKANVKYIRGHIRDVSINSRYNGFHQVLCKTILLTLFKNILSVWWRSIISYQFVNSALVHLFNYDTLFFVIEKSKEIHWNNINEIKPDCKWCQVMMKIIKSHQSSSFIYANKIFFRRGERL